MNSHVSTARRLMTAFGNELRARRQHHRYSSRRLEAEIDVRHDIITRTEKGVWVPAPDDEERLLNWMVHHPITEDS